MTLKKTLEEIEMWQDETVEIIKLWSQKTIEEEKVDFFLSYSINLFSITGSNRGSKGKDGRS